jgi:hypothetical protein
MKKRFLKRLLEGSLGEIVLSLAVLLALYSEHKKSH